MGLWIGGTLRKGRRGEGKGGLGQKKSGSMGVQPCPPAPERWSDSLGLWGREGSALGGSPTPLSIPGLIGGSPHTAAGAAAAVGQRGWERGGRVGVEEEQEEEEGERRRRSWRTRRFHPPPTVSTAPPALVASSPPILLVSGEGESPQIYRGSAGGVFLEGCLELADSGIEPQMSLHVPGRDFCGRGDMWILQDSKAEP